MGYSIRIYKKFIVVLFIDFTLSLVQSSIFECILLFEFFKVYPAYCIYQETPFKDILRDFPNSYACIKVLTFKKSYFGRILVIDAAND